MAPTAALIASRDGVVPPSIRDPSDITVGSRRKCTKLFVDCVPSIGNFSIQYNFTSASIAVQLLNEVKKPPSWSADLTLPIVFFGAMIGMACMGRLGDVLGRTKSLRITLALTMLGAALPACAPIGDFSSTLTYGVVVFGRLVLGVGVGGIYPLSAVSSAEACEDGAARGRSVGIAFFWQTLGAFVPYPLAMLLITVLTDDFGGAELQTRLLFALGVVPAGIVLLAAAGAEDSEEFRTQRQQQPEGAIAQLRRQAPEMRRTLLGTAGSWFLYDVTYYGTGIFTPKILDAICLTGAKVDGVCQQSIYDTSKQSAIVTIMGVPACILAIWLVKIIGSKRLNVYGFLLIAGSFAALAISWTEDPNATNVQFVLFCIITFLLNFGPNVGTYVLPAICFPSDIRSTCHGLSATGGKVGAFFGALLFAPISNSRLGVPGVLWIQVAMSLIGAWCSQHFLQHDWDYLNQDDRVATQAWVEGQSSVCASHDGPIVRSCNES